MNTLVRIHRKGQMTLPSRLRSAIGVVEGDLVEVSVQRGRIVLTPQLVIDRSKLPRVEREHTPKQRRSIDRGIAQSLKEFKQGRARGPFETHEAFVASLHTETRKRQGKNKLMQ